MRIYVLTAAFNYANDMPVRAGKLLVYLAPNAYYIVLSNNYLISGIIHVLNGHTNTPLIQIDTLPLMCEFEDLLDFKLRYPELLI